MDYHKYVLELDDDTFDQAVKDNKYLLVAFCVPWGEGCKRLKEEYELAAYELDRNRIMDPMWE